MPTLNKGILTDAGADLFRNVEAGKAQITYTKAVFCDDKDLLNMSDDDIRKLNDVHSDNEVTSQPQAYDNGTVTGKNNVQASEVDIRAVADNEGVKTGFYPYVEALYASDGNNEILYGVVVDDKPGYLPQYDGFTPQPLVLNWRLFTATTDNFNLASGKDIYATIADLKGIEDSFKEFVNQEQADFAELKKQLEDEFGSDFKDKLASLEKQINQLENQDTNDINALKAKMKILSGQSPATPTLQAIMATNNGTLHYSITQPSKYDAGDVYQYHIYYKLTTDNNYQEVDSSNSSGSIPNLDATKEYNVYAVAENAGGLSDHSNMVETGKANVPDAPSLKASMDTSKATITYNITAPDNNGGADITDYQLFYKKVSDQNYTMIDAQTYMQGTIGSLDPKSKYNLYVQAINLAGVSEPSNVVTTDIIDSNVYGVTSTNISNPSLTRTDAAAQLPNAAGINGQENDFDNYSVWKLMHRVTDNSGNVFVRIPAFYIYKDIHDTTYTVKISLTSHGNGWYLPQCFINHSNNSKLPYVDVGAYDASDNGNGGLSSKTGDSPLVNTDLDDFRNKARADGTGYQILDMHVWDALECLFVVEFATLNSQAVMEGVDNSGSAVNNGATDNQVGSSHTNGSGSNSMCYRGIENLYGNVFQWIDGISWSNNTLYVCDDPTQYQSNVFASPYNGLGYTANSGSGWISQLGYDPDHPEANLPIAFNGSDSSYFCDYGNVGYGYSAFCVGGHWGNTSYDGVFYWGNGDPSNTDSSIGSRLIKKAVD